MGRGSINGSVKGDTGPYSNVEATRKILGVFWASM